MKFKSLLSLKSLIVLAFAAAAIPLFLGVTHAAFGLREAAELGRSINTQVFEQTKIIRQVLQQSSDIERKARLFVLLSDPRLRQPYERESYEAARVSFKQSLSDLLKLQVDNKIALLVNELAEKENLIYAQIISSESEDNFKLPIDEAFFDFREASNTLSREFENHVEHTFNNLGRMSESSEQALLFKGALLLLFVCVIALILLKVLSQSTQQLENAILRLSTGDLQEPIVVNGPTDLQDMGKRLDRLRKQLVGRDTTQQQLLHRLAGAIAQPVHTLCSSLENLDTNGDLVIKHIKANLQTLESVSAQLHKYSQCIEIPAPEAWQTLDMQTLLNNSLERLSDRLQIKAIIIKKHTRSLEFVGIAPHCRQILEQLLDNAIRFSPTNGEIRISLHDSDDYLELDIEDDGPGINPEQRTLVFEPFFHIDADGATNALVTGGMGLALVKAYVNSQFGDVTFIDPSPNHHGARVRLRLPLDINA